jgi:hypothetical protein
MGPGAVAGWVSGKETGKELGDRIANFMGLKDKDKLQGHLDDARTYMDGRGIVLSVEVSI